MITVVGESDAIKQMDFSSFMRFGTAVPVETRDFFEISNFRPGHQEKVVLLLNGIEYSANLQRVDSSSRVTRLMWKKDLCDQFNKLFPNAVKNNSYPVMKIHKRNSRYYELSFEKHFVEEEISDCDNHISFTTKHLLNYTFSGKKGHIPIKAVKSYVDFDPALECERKAAHFEGKYIVFLLSAFSDQAGIIGVWDCAQETLVHVSDGSYVLEATISDNEVWAYMEVSSFVMPCRRMVSHVRFGVMNPRDGGTVIKFGIIGPSED